MLRIRPAAPASARPVLHARSRRRGRRSREHPRDPDGACEAVLGAVRGDAGARGRRRARHPTVSAVVAPVASGRGGGIPVGLHHVTAICANLNRTTAFYTEVLGLRLVKRTVNYDDPATEHFYFGDAVGSPGSVLSFFEWSHLAPDQVGLGTAHHVVLTVPDDGAQRRWIARLRRFCVATAGPKDRTYCRSVYFQDPDGLILELATRGPGFAVDEAEDRL
ncbi:MAG: hypothetical protein FJX78_09160, partial [Armatimonadetes bacterium]|nr:hypothetical protein [Armatimonadota bacterium]